MTKRQLVVLGAAALSAAVMAAPAHAGIGLHGPLTERYGFFPEHYQDANGVRLQLCIDLAATCGAVATPGPGPVSFPNNFPDELFYWSASASVRGVSLTLAQEATFDGVDGDQAVFGRLRIRGTGLTSGEWYRFTTPYGILEEQAGAGDPQIKDIGSDLGCGPAIGAVCTDATFSDVGASLIGPNFLTWDTGAPAGFVGDAVTPHAVTGSAFTAPGELTPANYFQVDRISGAGGTVVEGLGRETNFVVQGKLADNPPQPFLLTTPGAAGNQPIAAGPRAFTVKVRNGGSGDLKVATAAVVGGDFAITSHDCAAKTIVPAGRTQDPGNANQFCTVTLAFDPSTAGTKSATLRVTEQAPAGTVHDIALTGVATQPALGTDQAGVSFGAQQVGTSAPTQTVTVRNTGGASLLVNGASTSGDFSIVASTCASNALAPNATCSIDLHFTPTAAGVRNGTLDISSAAGTRSVPLSGTGSPAPVTTGAAGAAAGGGTAPGATTIAAPQPELALGRLGMAARVKRSVARRQGIRIFMDLPSGAEVVKINVYRRTGARLRLISSVVRSPARVGRLTLRQGHLALRRLLTVGSYELRVTPGRSRSDLGSTSKVSFRVVRG